MGAYKERWRRGEAAHFEYHCLRSHDSSDAELWYRSHQCVTVVRTVESGCGRTSARRADNGQPRVYLIRFADGFERSAFEDELLTDSRWFDVDMGPGARPTDSDLSCNAATR
jgi:hypothetical protein